jgi:hypothetical protein
VDGVDVERVRLVQANERVRVLKVRVGGVEARDPAQLQPEVALQGFASVSIQTEIRERVSPLDL